MFRIVLISGVAVAVAGSAALALSFAHDSSFSQGAETAPRSALTSRTADVADELAAEVAAGRLTAPSDDFVVGDAPSANVSGQAADPLRTRADAEEGGIASWQEKPAPVIAAEKADIGALALAPVAEPVADLPLNAIAAPEPAAPAGPATRRIRANFSPLSTGVFR